MAISNTRAIAISISSRIVIIGLSILSDAIFKDHTAQDVAHFSGRRQVGDCDTAVSSWLQAFTKWDAAHYLNIAAHSGYREEMEVAFMPLYPSFIRLVARVIKIALPGSPDDCRGDADRLVVSALGLNAACFVLASLVLIQLLALWNLKQSLQLLAFWLHIFNPANIFFTTAYTESIYAATAWLGILLLEKERYLWACLPFFVASMIRSNGIMNAAIPACMLLCKSLTAVKTNSAASIVRLLTLLIPPCAASLVPFLLLDNWNHSYLCSFGASYGQTYEKACLLQIGVPRYFGTYSFIQKKYWNVGWLQYYQLVQLPNILLAVPIVVIACAIVARRDGELNSPLLWKHKVHLSAILVIGLGWAHTEILTRLLLASCPIMYVGLASLLLDYKRGQNLFLMRLLFTYMIMFNLLGILLHVNFYPWT